MRPDLRRVVPAPALLAAAAVLASTVLVAPGAAVATGAAETAVAAPTAVSASSAIVARAAGASWSGRPTFRHPLATRSRYFPLVPGMRFSYEGTVTDAEGTHRHRVVFVVTDLVKRVGGVNARVVLDKDYNDGVLTEAELAFFSQDGKGNVWTRGEYPEEYENGRFQGAPSTWVTGVRGARAGILVPGRPRVGTAAFVQGRAPAIGFFDVGKVVARGLRVCVPTGCYSNVVEIRESAPNAPEDGIQLKYYAPHVGLVRIAARGGDSREVMVLTSVRRLCPRELQAVRAEALRLDRRAYHVSEDYRATGRAHLLRWWHPRRA